MSSPCNNLNYKWIKIIKRSLKYQALSLICLNYPGSPEIINSIRAIMMRR